MFHTYLCLAGLAVLAAFLNAAAVGAPRVPVARIRSPEPAAILFCLACMLAYNPGLVAMSPVLLFTYTSSTPGSCVKLTSCA
jgi:hypothetical protein